MSFLALRPHAVALLKHVSLSNPANLAVLPPILHSFEDALLSISKDIAIPPTLSSYTFFPFSQFLQVNHAKLLKSTPTHQSVFCDVLRVLAVLLRVCPFEQGVLEQLWTFCALTLGGPLGSSSSNHNLDISWNEGMRQRILSLLETILQSDNAEQLQIPGSIVAHTLNAILLLAERDVNETRLVALDTLQSLVEKYLGPQDKLPQSLPGTVSTLCKVILASRGNSQITVRSLRCFTAAVKGAMSDDRSSRLDLFNGKDTGEAKVASSLEELFARPMPQDHRTLEEDWSVTAISSPFGNGAPKSDYTSSKPGHSKAWLRATALQLHRAFVSLLPVLRNHDNALVRASFASFCCGILADCHRSLSKESVRLLLEELLVLSCDSWKDVSVPARAGLDQLASTSDFEYDFIKITEETLASLPHSIFTYGVANENALQRQLNILTAAARRSSPPFSGLKMEKWSRTLVRALEFVPISNSASSSKKMDATAPWLQANQSTLFLEQAEQTDPTSSSQKIKRLPPYPSLRFTHIAPGTSVTLLTEAIQAVSASSQSCSSALLEHFMSLAGYPEPGVPGSASTASALWIVAQILEGITSSKKAGGALSLEKKERMVRDVVELAKAWLERENDEDEERGTAPSSTTNGSSSALLESGDNDNLQAIQVVSGTTQLGNVLGPEHRTSSIAPTQSRKPDSFDIYIRSLALQLLGVSSSLLGTNFRPHLMHILYPLLRCLSPSMAQNHPLVQAYAYVSLTHIASHSGYPSSSSMITHNVDYILNSISAHLRGNSGSGSLDPLAPSVLVCVVDLAGEEVLPHLGDAVDEIFDALDRWHAYDLLVSELLRVLDRLVGVCKVEERDSPSMSEKSNEQMQAVLEAQPEREKDLLAFEEWFRGRLDKRRDRAMEPISDGEESRLPEANPQQPFADLKASKAGEADEAINNDQAAAKHGDTDDTNDEGTPATRPQVLVLAILRKCRYYIGHPSPFLRARVLSLVTTCVPLLADRSPDLLPEVQRFWPYILARLDDPAGSTPSYVLLECMRLISALMEHKGDFMNLRIISDIWPRLHTVLSSLRPPPTNAKSDQFTVQHRLVRASIITMQMAVSNVPGIKNGDAWDMAILFRRYLGIAWDPELRKEAGQFLVALGKVEADIVWLVLAAGRDGDQSMAYLTDENLDQTVVDHILASL